ncbi:MAG TPA: GNAT family N-acetyltransferase [Dongiaceae bacterium]|nr:GNAT family N-acetyltransferase [Dongiaceae bacterium]
MGAPLANVSVRGVEAADLDAIQRIYAYHVLHGLASFEEAPPDAAELTRRWHAIADAGLPYLCATDGADGAVLGYAYAAAYRARSAYRFAVEDSVYVAPQAARRGVGRALLHGLIDTCTDLGKRQMIAVIGDSGNQASIALHRVCGFELVGTFTAIGFKHGRWVDTVLMQRELGPGNGPLPG